ncbi:nijmegen breakage syndrome 1 protein isoform X1 [Coffea eugenioides]|uniref:nijmegen breakage syndrome 1 protein isoform X1 n=1 Tax=Coffea eugenioides TaxID=49369 RepID=UPI000F6135B8|nr:nijmegen breakage syndrome 1 protein isoform X1 [Coffea eugenioides]
MVWGLFPVDPLPGEDRYYFFSKGTYKVGRKGCDIIINKDKGVSRIHAEIVIDEMVCFDNPQRQSSDISSKVRIRDCSKYGTFVKKNLGSKEKVHEFPEKETMLKDGDLVSFGTGNATYRFGYVPFIFLYCCSKDLQVKDPLRQKILSIGACVAQEWSLKCTHVLIDDLVPLKEELIDAIVAKKPFISFDWIEFIAGKNICTEIPSYSSYSPTLLLEEASVRVADPQSRDNCLNGYTFLLESRNKYRHKDKLQPLLEVGGAKVASLEGFCIDSQVLEEEGIRHVVRVIPTGATSSSNGSQSIRSLPSVNEMDLISAVLSGHLDPLIIVSPPVLVTSSCSTDETVVADSDEEVETATAVHTSTAVYSVESSEHDSKEMTDLHMIESTQHDSGEETAINVIESTETDRKGNITLASVNAIEHEIKEEIPCNNVSIKWSEGASFTGLRNRDGRTGSRLEKVEESECGNVDVIYSQDLIVRDSLSASVHFSTNDAVINFKRFRKRETPSGNSFSSLIPFSKDPYKESDYGNEEVAEYLKEEKKRKQMEALAEDLFKYEKGRRRNAAGSRTGLVAYT